MRCLDGRAVILKCAMNMPNECYSAKCQYADQYKGDCCQWDC